MIGDDRNPGAHRPVDVGADPAIATAARVLGPRARLGHPLAALTTYRLGGPAAVFVEASSVADLALVAEASRDSGLPTVVIGRGSNLLIADEGVRAIVVSIAPFDEINLGAPDAPTEVIAGGGTPLPVLARRTAAAGLTGFEWAVGVPGSVGGAVRMNAGGHGSDMAACLISVDTFDLRESIRVTRHVDELCLGFRRSGVRSEEVVIEARLALHRGDPLASEEMIAEIVRWRRDHQPGGQNCGSVFVNPVPGVVAAGALIDQVGLRGYAIGTARVSEKHANFIQASPGGRARDVLAVMAEVRNRVADRTGHQLRTEVRLLGFDPADCAAVGAEPEPGASA